jgi:predicted nucleotidyltransferase
LTLVEIQKFLEIKVEETELKKELNAMTSEGLIFCFKECFLLHNLPERVDRKLQGMKYAQKRMKRAQFISWFIMCFPFVRMVAISGSLSKNYADKTTDIDFFVITTENQLWTSRTLLHLLKKLTFLVRLQHSFCMNYFLSENHLNIEENNYFTAVELATLIPKNGRWYYQELLAQNDWVHCYLPNFTFERKQISKQRPSFLKRIMEFCLGSNWLNSSLMKLTDRRWQNKWKKKGYDPQDYDLAFKTQLYVSKNHPGNYQKKILNHLESNHIQASKKLDKN